MLQKKLSELEEKLSTKTSCSTQEADRSLPLFSTPSDLPDSPPPLPPPIIPSISIPVPTPPPVFNGTTSPLQALNPATTPVLPNPTCNYLPSYDCSPGFLVQTRAMSCSRGNFAANLNRSWFSIEERKTSNVRGKNNKKKLSPKRIQNIYEAVFQMYPCTQKEIKECWSECIKAIDVCNRQLHRKGKEN